MTASKTEEARTALRAAVEARRRQAATLRKEGMKLDTIAQEVGVSRSRVSHDLRQEPARPMLAQAGFRTPQPTRDRHGRFTGEGAGSGKNEEQGVRTDDCRRREEKRSGEGK